MLKKQTSAGVIYTFYISYWSCAFT